MTLLQLRFMFCATRALWHLLNSQRNPTGNTLRAMSDLDELSADIKKEIKQVLPNLIPMK